MIPREAFEEWHKRYLQVKFNADGKDTEAMIAEIEKELIVVGATALED